MADLRPLVVPAVALAVVAGVIVFNLSGAQVDRLPTATPTRTPVPTYTPVPSPTPVVTTFDLTGTLVWQGNGDDVFELAAIQFPSGRWTQELPVIREPPSPDEFSSDGVWRVVVESCLAEISCVTSFVASDGRKTHVDAIAAFAGPAGIGGHWAPTGHAYAYTVFGPTLDAVSIVVIPDVSAPAPVAIYTAPPGTIIASFAWHGDNEFVIAEDDGTAIRFAVVTRDGTRRTLDAAPVAAGSLVSLHTAPGAEGVAFSTLSADGWGLATIDIASGIVSGHSSAGTTGGSTNDCRPNLPSGSPPFFAEPVPRPAPMGTSSSPDGSRLAFASSVQPPRTVTVLDLITNETALRGPFPSGIPRELMWRPDGTMIAVATYDDAAMHYETWLVDAATGEQRFLLEGCRLVWSPDSRFIAVRGSDTPGIAIIEVATGARLQLTQDGANVPIRWTPSE